MGGPYSTTDDEFSSVVQVTTIELVVIVPVATPEITGGVFSVGLAVTWAESGDSPEGFKAVTM